MVERNRVVLVDERGAVLGESAKLAAHERGDLHLAFSVVLYRVNGQVLLQQRAAGKYHFPSYWANACCSHPAPGEDMLASATSRVMEELGLDVELRPAGVFTYRAACPASGLVEHEVDHVFIGTSDAEPQPDPSEVAALCWVDPQTVLDGKLDLLVTPWLGGALRLAEQAR